MLHVRWLLADTDSITHFGENVLLVKHGIRPASAVTAKWSVVFRLDRQALKLSAKQFPSMNSVYRQLRTRKQTRLVRAIRTTLNSVRSNWAECPKLLVKVICGKNLPMMDGIIGSCDPYCQVLFGDPDFSEWKKYQTNVVHQRLDPEWHETFMYPVRKHLMDAVMRSTEHGKSDQENLETCTYPLLRFKVFDYDQFNKHDLVGLCDMDLTDLLIRALSKEGS